MSYAIGPDQYDRYDFSCKGGRCKCGARATKMVVIVAECKQYAVEVAECKQYAVEVCESCNEVYDVWIAVQGNHKFAKLIPKWAKDPEEYLR